MVFLLMLRAAATSCMVNCRPVLWKRSDAAVIMRLRKSIGFSPPWKALGNCFAFLGLHYSTETLHAQEGFLSLYLFYNFREVDLLILLKWVLGNDFKLGLPVDRGGNFFEKA